MFWITTTVFKAKGPMLIILYILLFFLDLLNISVCLVLRLKSLALLLFGFKSVIW